MTFKTCEGCYYYNHKDAILYCIFCCKGKSASMKENENE